MLDDLKILLERTKIEEHTLVHTNQDVLNIKLNYKRKKEMKQMEKKGDN